MRGVSPAVHVLGHEVAVLEAMRAFKSQLRPKVSVVK